MRKSFDEQVLLDPAIDKYHNDDYESDIKSTVWKFEKKADPFVNLIVRKTN